MTQIETHITAAGLEKLKAELHHLTEERRPIVVARIKAARELGDLKENADYHDARNEQSMIETKVLVLEQRIRTAVVTEATDANQVAIGTTVTIVLDGDTEVWHIVGAAEADPNENRISDESPIGQALLGAKPGDTVVATTPGGSMEMKVTAIAISD